MSVVQGEPPARWLIKHPCTLPHRFLSSAKAAPIPINQSTAAQAIKPRAGADGLLEDLVRGALKAGNEVAEGWTTRAGQAFYSGDASSSFATKVPTSANPTSEFSNAGMSEDPALSAVQLAQASISTGKADETPALRLSRSQRRTQEENSRLNKQKSLMLELEKSLYPGTTPSQLRQRQYSQKHRQKKKAKAGPLVPKSPTKKQLSDKARYARRKAELSGAQEAAIPVRRLSSAPSTDAALDANFTHLPHKAHLIEF